MNKPKRSRRLHMLLSEEEWEQLKSLAEGRGLTVSDYIRQHIRAEDKRTSGAR